MRKSPEVVPETSQEAAPREKPIDLTELAVQALELKGKIFNLRQQLLLPPEISGETDLASLLAIGQGREESYQQLTQHYDQAELMMEKGSRLVRVGWQLPQEVKEMVEAGQLPNTPQIMSLIENKETELRENWQAILFPSSVFYNLTPPHLRKTKLGYTNPEILALICAPFPAGGFAYGGIKELAEDILPQNLRNDERRLDLTRSRISDIKRGYQQSLLRKAHQETGRTINYLVQSKKARAERRGHSPGWQTNLTEMLSFIRVEIDGEETAIGEMTVEEFCKKVLNRFSGQGETQASRPVSRRKETLLVFPSPAQDALARIVRLDPVIVGRQGVLSFKFSPKSKLWATRRQEEMTGKKESPEEAQELRNHLTVLAEGQKTFLQEFAKRRKHNHPPLAEITKQLLKLGPQERAEFIENLLKPLTPLTG